MSDNSMNDNSMNDNSMNDNAFSMYEIISKKRDGGQLSTDEIQYFITDYVKENIPDYQAAALLMAIYLKGIDPRELADLTGFMMHSGDLISLDGIPGKKIDKHSTGGVGDKISFIVSPLVAACGVRVPMLSGRSLGHTGGTLDKLESIPGLDVFLETGAFRDVLNKVGMVICGQTGNIVPADRKMYALRDATATVNNIPLICASIMSKKLALGTDGIILDVKTGSGAFMRRLEDSIELCNTMVKLGEDNGRRTIGIITDMDQPLGEMVGNSLEIIESIEALKGNGPADTMAVTYALGAGMLVAANAAKDYDEALKMLEQALKTGKPLKIFRDFIAAQGGDVRVCDDYSLLPQCRIKEPLTAKEDGYVSKIDALETGLTAVDIGGGRRKKEDQIDHGAGIVFHKKVGDTVREGEPLLTIHTNNPGSIEPAKQRLSKAISITLKKVSRQKTIRYLIDKTGSREWRFF